MDRALIQLRRHGEAGERHEPADAGHGVEQSRGRRRHAVEALRDQGFDVAAFQMLVDALDVPVPAFGFELQRAVATQGVQQLQRVERIATRQRLDRTGERRRILRREPQAIADHLGLRRRPQVLQMQLAGCEPQPLPARDQCAQRMRGIDFVVPIGGEDQDAAHVLVEVHGIEHVERGARGPLQVVDDQHDRAAGHGQRPQQQLRDLLQAGARLAGGRGSAGLRIELQQVRHFRQQRAGERRVDAERGAETFAQRRKLGLRFRQQQPQHRAQRLAYAVGFRVLLEGIELARRRRDRRRA